MDTNSLAMGGWAMPDVDAGGAFAAIDSKAMLWLAGLDLHARSSMHSACAAREDVRTRVLGVARNPSWASPSVWCRRRFLVRRHVLVAPVVAHAGLLREKLG